ncbi:hypothetical protein K435DRAFT_880847 [Dendrothele bispora CBS 962.96]|uniref:Uncharacterized protein n=1 Tax=Dendrothele bispora (strain CBS 962.96) TaxID=1314807 RepID=A0A4S8KJ35_DENBC|nr:hypothetical protein K435DRAFT_880847 [Dendrothele bispora CBS 962.96]
MSGSGATDTEATKSSAAVQARSDVSRCDTVAQRLSQLWSLPFCRVRGTLRYLPVAI